MNCKIDVPKGQRWGSDGVWTLDEGKGLMGVSVAGRVVQSASLGVFPVLMVIGKMLNDGLIIKHGN